MQQDLFGLAYPETEGIKYTGSKLKILPHIINIISELDIKNILDGFSGTTRVSQAFAQLGFNTTANDISEWSYVFATCYLMSKKNDAFYQSLIDELNNLNGYEGWFSQNYGGMGDNCKKPFQLHNTKKLDAIRDKIEEWSLDWEDKCVLLTSLIYAMDSVDNTLGHYAAYLSKWSPRSYNTMYMKLPRRFAIKSENCVIKGDVFDIVKKPFDLVYFDPPYGSNNEKMPPSRVRYAAYYHIWKTIILNDKPVLFGSAGRRIDTKDTVSPSVFEEFRKNENGKFVAMQAINDLIEQTNSRYILLSYSSGGRATKSELYDILNTHGKLISAKEINYKRNVMGSMKWTNEWINDDGQYKEYLFLMEKF